MSRILERTSIYLCLESLGLKLNVLNGSLSKGNMTKFEINK